MRLRPSRLGFFALAFGLLGAVSAVGLMTWITLVDYPLVIGGKPFWSWPAFVPVAFEITVLLASVLSVVAMIVLYFKFPNTSHPLHDTPYMKRVSSDRFGLVHTWPTTPHSTSRRYALFLESSGRRRSPRCTSIPEELDHGQKLFDPRFIGVLAVTALVMAAGTYVTLNHLLYMEPFYWMMHQTKLKAQAPSELFRGRDRHAEARGGDRGPGFLPYPYHGKPEAAGKDLVNPLPARRTVLDRGKAEIPHVLQPVPREFRRWGQPAARAVPESADAPLRQGAGLA